MSNSVDDVMSLIYKMAEEVDALINIMVNEEREKAYQEGYGHGESDGYDAGYADGEEEAKQ